MTKVSLIFVSGYNLGLLARRQITTTLSGKVTRLPPCVVRFCSTYSNDESCSVESKLEKVNVDRGKAFTSTEKIDLKPSLNSKSRITEPAIKEDTSIKTKKTSTRINMQEKTRNHVLNKKSMVNDHGYKKRNGDQGDFSSFYEQGQVRNRALNRKSMVRDNGYRRKNGDLGEFSCFHEQGQVRRNEQRRVEKKFNFNDHGLSGLGTNRYKMSKRQTSNDVMGEILFGMFPVLLALKSNFRKCKKLFIKEKIFKDKLDSKNSEVLEEILKLAEEHDVEIQPCNKNLLIKLSGDRPHQGVCLDVSEKEYTSLLIEDTELIDKQESPKVWLYFDSINDPMNFGGVLRTSYYLGVDRVVCGMSHSCRLSPVVSKASAGVLELQSIYSTSDLPSLVQALKGRGWQVVGTAGSVEKVEQPLKVQELHKFKLQQNTLLLLGNEGKGLSDTCVDLCDLFINITRRENISPHVDSLNVSVATGIILHHLLSKDRQSTES